MYKVKKLKLLGMILCLSFLFTTGCGPTVRYTVSTEQDELAQDINSDLGLVIDSILKECPIRVNNGLNYIDLKESTIVYNYTGLNEQDLNKLSDIVVSESTSGDQGYKLILMRVSNSKNASGIAKSVKKFIQDSSDYTDTMNVESFYSHDLVMVYVCDDSDVLPTCSEIGDAFMNTTK